MDGQRLRELRIEAKMTQQSLADILSVDVSSVGKWELHNFTPAPSTLSAIADLFNVSVDFLLGRGEDIFKSSRENVLTLRLKDGRVKAYLLSDTESDALIPVLELIKRRK